MNTTHRASLLVSVCTVGAGVIFSFRPVPAEAQITLEQDNITNTSIVTTNNKIVISGGQLSGNGKNLFHGFNTFNVNTNEIATFLSSPSLNNIFSRVSGGDISNINGILQVMGGSPNLYLINPAGIIFGNNAQLNVPGDFVATTATGISFGNHWFNVSGNSDFASLVGEPTQFSFQSGTVGDIWVKGNLTVPTGDLGILGGRIQGDGTLKTPENLLVTTATAGQVIQLRQPGHLLSLEIAIPSENWGNPLNFAVSALPELLTGTGDIHLKGIDAKYGIIAANNQLNFDGSSLATRGHLALLGAEINTQNTSGLSGLNQLFVSGNLVGIYQTHKPFLAAIANGINFAIDADPVTGAPIIVTDNALDTLETATLAAGDINLINSQFQAQNIYLLGDNINIQGSQLKSSLNNNIFALNALELKDSLEHPLNLISGQDTFLRGNVDLKINSFLNPDSLIQTGRNLSLSAEDLFVREARLESQQNIFADADHILIQNSQLNARQNIQLTAKNSLILEDIPDLIRDTTYTTIEYKFFDDNGNYLYSQFAKLANPFQYSDRPLQLLANRELILNSGDIFRVMTPKGESLLQGKDGITMISDGEAVELVGNFSSEQDVIVGSLTLPNLMIEGGNWDVGGSLSWLAQNNLILKDFHKTASNNYGVFSLPLTVTANEINLAGNDLISLYLGDASYLNTTKDLTVANPNKIYITGNLSSEGDLTITAKAVEIGVNSLAIGMDESGLPLENVLGRSYYGEAKPNLYFGGNFVAGGDLTLTAQDRLTLTDLKNQPLNLMGENISITGQKQLYLDVLNDVNSKISATQTVSFLENLEFDIFPHPVNLWRVNVEAGTDISLQASRLDIEGGQFTAGEKLSFIADQSLSLTNLSGHPLVAIAPQINIQSENIQISLFDHADAKIQTLADLNLINSSSIGLSGNITTAGNLYISSHNINLSSGGDNLFIVGITQLTSGQNMSLIASNQLSVTNQGSLNLKSGENLLLQGANAIDIKLYQAASSIQSGQDTTLVSNGRVLSDARYNVGGDFKIQNLAGAAADWFSSSDDSSYSIYSFYRNINNQSIPRSTANLAQVYSAGNISFNNFYGRSLILEAGEIITAQSINLDVPRAFTDETLTTQNFPEPLLSLKAGMSFSDPQQALFIDSIRIKAEVPFMFAPAMSELVAQQIITDAENMMWNAISMEDPVSTSIPITLQVLLVDNYHFYPIQQTFIEPVGGFPTSPPAARAIAVSGSGGMLNATAVSLTELDNPLDATSSSPNYGSGTTDDFSQDVAGSRGSRGSTAAIEETKNKILAAKKCADKKATDEDYLEILACHTSEVRSAQEKQDLVAQSNALYDLAVFYYQNSRFLESLKTYEERLTLVQSSGDRLGEIQTLQSIAQVYSALGEYDLALQSNRNALALLEKVNTKDDTQLNFLKQSITNNFAFLSYVKGDYAAATENYQQSLNLARSINDQLAEVEALSQLGLSYFQQVNYVQAKALQEEALKLVEPQRSPASELLVHENLAITEYALENYDRAIEQFQFALALAREVGDRHAMARNLSNIGDAQFKAGQNETAVQSLSSAIQLLEDLREELGDEDLLKVALFETQETTYSILQEVLLAQKEYDQALEMLERGRSRAFVDRLTRSYGVESKVTAEAPDLQTIQRIAKEQQATLVSYAITRKIEAVQGRRQEVETALWIWVVKPDGSVDFRQQNLAELHNRGMTMTDLIVDSRCFGDPMCLDLRQEEKNYQNPLFWEWEDENIDPYLQLLHRLLIDPIADLLPKNSEQEVIFVPHRSLFMVPFAALQNADGQYLIEQHTIRTTPSIQVLDLTHQQRQKINSEGIALVGNPQMPAGLAQLPGAAQEAQAIAKMFNSKNILLGNAATEAAVIELMKNRQFIHLASHGLLNSFTTDDNREIPGAIALTPTATSDGFLTTGEILNLNLNSEMVVLSACDTGRGKITEDGVIGLSRAFMAAGVPSVVVSLWQVPDEATSELMIEFYKNMQTGSTKAEALRQAMLHNLEKYEHPQDWAAFTLMGET